MISFRFFMFDGVQGKMSLGTPPENFPLENCPPEKLPPGKLSTGKLLP